MDLIYILKNSLIIRNNDIRCSNSNPLRQAQKPFGKKTPFLSFPFQPIDIYNNSSEKQAKKRQKQPG